ncbi:hypothetical protein [Larkinella soli]|uniref:hypothetical protein n=1 Tax=Larkinella soli TaxID=1770527 RepID=UPI0013E30991|nr:hypothetical protein [Larkinella soli]
MLLQQINYSHTSPEPPNGALTDDPVLLRHLHDRLARDIRRLWCLLKGLED